MKKNYDGKWVRLKDVAGYYDYWMCPVCGFIFSRLDEYSPRECEYYFCPGCGTQMIEKNNSVEVKQNHKQLKHSCPCCSAPIVITIRKRAKGTCFMEYCTACKYSLSIPLRAESTYEERRRAYNAAAEAWEAIGKVFRDWNQQ